MLAVVAILAAVIGLLVVGETGSARLVGDARRGPNAQLATRGGPRPAALERLRVSGSERPDASGRAPASPAASNWAAAVGPLPVGWEATTQAIRIGGRDRSYLLVRPAAAADASLPVVMAVPGRGMTPASMARVSHFVAITGPAILVFPAGYDRSWNAGACCGAAQRAGINDVGFLAAIAHQVTASQAGAAPDRVYLVGYSNGGRLAYRMACVDPGAFAGVAAVEAVPVVACARTDPVPIMIVASQRDPLLTIGRGAPPKVINGYVEPTVAATLETWRKLDGCAASHTQSTQGQAIVTTWADCRRGGRVAFVLYPGGSHAWPEAGPGRPSAQSLVWQFFRGPSTSEGR